MDDLLQLRGWTLHTWQIYQNNQWLDGMENNRIFKTMKRQWNISITESELDAAISILKPVFHFNRIVAYFFAS
jgi:hypothetical protein